MGGGLQEGFLTLQGPGHAGGGLGDTGPTLERVLLHVDFVEFVGSDEDTVIGEVDAAAGL